MAQEYKTGRLVARVISGLGWAVAGLGSLASIGFAIYAGTQFGAQAALIGLSGVVSAVIMGLILVATGQVYRAIMDNADYTRQMFDYIRNN